MQPYISETIGRNTVLKDLRTKLYQDRIIFIDGDITSERANSVVMQLLWLKADNPDKDIDIYINSFGGCVYSGYAIKDVIHSLDCKVNTYGVGTCMSMGGYLLSCGTGVRSATKNCRIMLHAVSSHSQGTIHDIEVDFKETKYLHDKIIQDVLESSKGKLDKDTLLEKTQRDWYMSPEEAIKFGIIDKVV